MASMQLLDAAAIIQASYSNANKSEVVQKFNVGGVQARLLKGGVLVIPGTNERSDWTKFNFDVMSGDSKSVWHAGFYRHAMIVYPFAKLAKPKVIVGHSLGAASAQIVGMSLGIPTIAFASPRPLRGKLKSSHGKWVINVNRLDDLVCNLPPAQFGFGHVGKTYWIRPSRINVGEDHRIDKYISLLKLKRVRRKVPSSWPQ